MTTYTVLSDRMPFPQGDTVTDDQLEGVNIDALVAGGHLKPGTPPVKKGK